MSSEAETWAWNQASLTSNQKYVLISVCRHASPKPDFECWPSLKRLSSMTSLSERTVQRSINFLIDNNYISKTPRYDGARQTSNLYQINMKNWAGLNEIHGCHTDAPRQGVAHEGATKSSPRVTGCRTNNTNELLKNNINVVWDYFVQKIGSTAKFDDSRKRMIAARLKTFTVDELKIAVDGLASSKYHAGDNESGKTYQTPGHVFRSTDQVDKMREMIDKPKFHVESTANKCSKCGVKSNMLMGKPALCNECHAEKEKQDEILAARRFSQSVSQKVAEVGNGAQMPSKLRDMVSSITNKTKI